MTDGWRNRFMAPVYALVISFVLAVILGAVLDDPMRIRFTILGQGGSDEKADELQGLPVLVKTADGRRDLADKPLDRSREITLVNPHKDILICTTLPKGRFAVGAAAPGPLGTSCWHEAPGKDVEITLIRQGALTR